ncbi:MAG: SCO family protein [Kiritimatiellae bacterium]|nr:SCO family protein [Kiritimatiellia bacterium]MCO5068594.1 SCO family protein [Kiritimatiellia bacterium]
MKNIFPLTPIALWRTVFASFLLVGALATQSALAAACCTAPDEEEGETAQLSSDSIYQLEDTWTNADGATVRLSDLRGPHRIVAMFYASCTYVCPMLVADLKKIEAKLPADAKVEFTLFSFDPDRDTPAALKKFAARQDIALPNWHLLTGSEDGARELSAVLGIRYRKEPNGDIAHSSPITLLDGDGRIVAQLSGLNEDPAPLLSALSDAHDH